MRQNCEREPRVAALAIIASCGSFLAGCSFSERVEPVPVLAKDPHSCARPMEAVVTDLSLRVDVDFVAKTLRCRAEWSFVRQRSARALWLDTRGLEILAVRLRGRDESSERDATYELGAADELLGRSLRISIDDSTTAVIVEYETEPGAPALQWLAPEQTAGGTAPFLFTQSQAILARTWVPCQDTPGVRFTYSATVEVDASLTALMSAGRRGIVEAGESRVEFSFRMPQPVPSYLLALAVGELEFRTLGPRSGVWAEPSVVDGAAWEFADVEAMIASCERLFGPYRWERYDVLVLPPSFPFGGMENPRLTFATPTILAGDRSLVALIAHELAHSWSGNLVTNATWDDFWLNEGFTVYLEHRIMEENYGKAYDDMLAQLGRDDLERTVGELTTGPDARPADTHLKLDLAGRNPDDGMIDIAYEKGYLFLRTCEEAVGRERWDTFLRSYFDAHAFHSMTTELFVEELRTRLIGDDSALGERLAIDAWIYGPGIPANAAEIRSESLLRVEQQVACFVSGVAPGDLETAGWSSHEWLHFLRELPLPFDRVRLAVLDSAFEWTSSGNAEISCQWFLVAIASGYDVIDAALERFLRTVGRRKFLEPLYEALLRTPDGATRAHAIYARARAGYHRIATDTIDALIGFQRGTVGP